ncbi:hypothetical protein GCM10023185_46340 [Hymenobacter saemangeumensis]|uniref:3-oxoacyl-ACP synthase n=1 Tax=Hymenobacter saemangeumensis TaxID=1084522 RepID=A0ABP8IST7_9BACT
MKSEPRILRSCLVRDHAIRVDGQEVFALAEADFNAFATKAFAAINPAYPKFYKMDGLAKLGLLAAEYLLAGIAPVSAADPYRVGAVVSNASSSTDTDLRYAALAQQQLASPALFVYTLPNIVIGEMCIRHGFKGENNFFVSASYNIDVQTAYTAGLFQAQLLDYCLVGWLEFLQQQYHGFLCLIGHSAEPHLPLYSTEKVSSLFNQ